MKKIKKKILVLCPYPINTVPGQRLKYEQYFNYLRKYYILDIRSFFSKKSYYYLYKKNFFFLKLFYVVIDFLRRIKLIFSLKEYDGAYVFLYVAPFFKIYEYIYSFLLKKIIYDIDDMIFIQKSNKNKIANFLRDHNKYIFLIKKSHNIIVCTKSLMNMVKKYNKRVNLIPATLDEDKYVPKKNKNQITIGWTGSHSTGHFLNIIKKVLIDIKKRFNCKILIIGANPEDIGTDEFEYIKWNSKSEIKNLNKIDIGVYPLTYDEWVYGKSGLKAIQYSALKIPVVATSVANNLEIIKNGYNGFLVKNNNHRDWYNYLNKLITNYKLRKKIGSNGRKMFLEFHSLKNNKNKYLKIFQKTFN
jgi:glycosyltransferase involved in cell wall biosynthesis